jgi:hypothetical protein
VDAGFWRIAVTTDPVSDPVYYRLQGVAGGSLSVDGGTVSQDFASVGMPGQPGWTATTVRFMDGCDEVDGLSWCIYYDMTVQSPTAMSGFCVIVGPNDQEFRFPATGQWVSP